MKKQPVGITALAAFLLIASIASAQRVKDIASLYTGRETQLVGYGLVMGLANSGDSPRSLFTNQSVSSLLKKFGISVPTSGTHTRNVAAIMVTATLSPLSKEGSTADVTVSSIGDATSLFGGTLLLTPLMGQDGQAYGTAQGVVSVGGFDVQTGSGSFVRRNHTAAGRVVRGAVLDHEVAGSLLTDAGLRITLNNADYTTAVRVAQAIGKKFGLDTMAIATSSTTVHVTVPDAMRSPAKLTGFISELEMLEVAPDVPARVVINEKSGTIVVGSTVRILPCAISHGGLDIQVQSSPVISQPAPFSGGKTISRSRDSISVQTPGDGIVEFKGGATVQEVASALSALNVAPRDLVAIFEAMHDAGALHAEIVVE